MSKEQLEELREIGRRRGKRRDVGPLRLDEARQAQQGYEAVRSGPGLEREPVPVDFEVKERRSAGVSPQALPYGRPRWAIEMVGNEASVEQMLQEIIERVRREPNEKVFRQAELMLRDLARDERGKALVSRFLTQDLAARLTGAETKKGER